jgi:transposase
MEVRKNRVNYSLHSTTKKLTFPRIGRVSKAEIYSIKIKEGNTYGKDSKSLYARVQRRSGKPITHIAHELGISDASIHQRLKELAQHGTAAFPGSGHQTALEEENRRLKRELKRVQQERDILKKVVSIFSRESK